MVTCLQYLMTSRVAIENDISVDVKASAMSLYRTTTSNDVEKSCDATIPLLPPALAPQPLHLAERAQWSP